MTKDPVCLVGRPPGTAPTAQPVLRFTDLQAFYRALSGELAGSSVTLVAPTSTLTFDALEAAARGRR